MNPLGIWRFLVEVVNAWLEDKASRLGAALAYYSVFSLAPLLVLAVGVAGLIFDRETARHAIDTEIRATVGEPAATALDELVKNLPSEGGSRLAAIVGLITLIIGASGVFAELQDALNTVWKVKPRPDRTWRDIVRERFLSFAIVLGTGFLLLISLVLTALLSALGNWLAGELPGGAALWHIVNALVSFGFVTVLFALIFKLMPDVQVQWHHVWLGAAVTAFLFTIGKFLIGLYLGQSGATSTFGAAASLVVILLWVYYSSQILLFGAEFTRVYARRFERVPPAENAQPVTQRERARQGMPAPSSGAA